MSTRRTRRPSTTASTAVLGYIRVSTDEQADSGAGLEAQRQAILAECDRRGWELAEIVEDAGYSAKDLKRPGIIDVLERLARGEAGTLVVAKLDRLSRSVLDFAGLMAQSQQEGWALVALDLGVDTTTPQGELMAGVMAQFAQFERRLIGQRTKAALAIKKQQGVTLGRPRSLPEGIVARIAAERAAGATLRAIAEGLNAEGVATAQGGARWWPATVKNVLESRAA